MQHEILAAPDARAKEEILALSHGSIGFQAAAKVALLLPPELCLGPILSLWMTVSASKLQAHWLGLAMLTLGAAASAVGSGARVHVRQPAVSDSTWIETGVIWPVVVQPTGSGNAYCFDCMLPLPSKPQFLDCMPQLLQIQPRLPCVFAARWPACRQEHPGPRRDGAAQAGPGRRQRHTGQGWCAQRQTPPDAC